MALTRKVMTRMATTVMALIEMAITNMASTNWDLITMEIEIQQAFIAEWDSIDIVSTEKVLIIFLIYKHCVY